MDHLNTIPNIVKSKSKYIGYDFIGYLILQLNHLSTCHDTNNGKLIRSSVEAPLEANLIGRPYEAFQWLKQ